jgi:hypothetical protein
MTRQQAIGADAATAHDSSGMARQRAFRYAGDVSPPRGAAQPQGVVRRGPSAPGSDLLGSEVVSVQTDNKEKGS